MNDPLHNKNMKDPTGFHKKISVQALRKIRAQKQARSGLWFGLGMMGLIGWSVVIPTLLGTALGIWIDKHHPGPTSWTLTLLVIGLVIGCLNAWYWVDKEYKEIKDKKENHNG